MNYAIHTEKLSKQFKGKTVINRLSLKVPEGIVYGFLGPNGAGKSTTMKILLGLLQPTSGEVTLLGQKLTSKTQPSLLPAIGSMIDSPAGYGHLTGWENMCIVRDMLGLSDQQINRALLTVRLNEHKDKLVRHYSLGMKQRLGIAMALSREPKLLILDEPTNGLDPAGIEEIRSLLIYLAEQGTTVMISSHLLDEIDKMASVLGIISEGHMIFEGSREALIEQSTPDLIISTPNPQEVISLGVEGIPQKGGVIIRGASKDRAASIIHQLATANVPIWEARRAERTLEEVFMDLTTGRGLV